MSYADALAQIGQIQAQMASLSTAFTPAAPTAGGEAAATPGATTSFADQLAQAQAPAQSDMLSTAQATARGDVFSPSQALTGVPGSSSPAGPLTGGQQQFASTLAEETGLNPQVISAWLLAEENGSAAQSRQAAGNNDWLNIGYTDGGTYGGADAIWSNPITAASATAGWLRGQNTIPGYGTASTGIQAILATAGQAPAAQISAIQQSGWASGGYPELATLYSQIAG